MLDWLTLRLPVECVPLDALLAYRESRPHLVRFVPATGVFEVVTMIREGRPDDLSSDAPFVQVHVGGSDIEISGSPARSLGLANNVFGSSDIRECARAHIRVAAHLLGFPLPFDLDLYRCTRVDVTHNYDLGSLANCRQAIGYLAQADGGRAGRVNRKWGDDTVLLGNSKSSVWSLKAYCKGPHLEYQVDKGESTATPDQLCEAQRYLRLECTLRRDFFRLSLSKKWYSLSAHEFDLIHREKFAKYIGTSEVVDMDDVKPSIERAVLAAGFKKNMVQSVFRTWRDIQVLGHRQVRENISKSTWHRHVAILQSAGLGWGDISAGEVIPLRRRSIVLDEPVTNWKAA